MSILHNIGQGFFLEKNRGGGGGGGGGGGSKSGLPKIEGEGWAGQ